MAKKPTFRPKKCSDQNRDFFKKPIEVRSPRLEKNMKIKGSVGSSYHTQLGVTGRSVRKKWGVVFFFGGGGVYIYKESGPGRDGDQAIPADGSYL